MTELMGFLDFLLDRIAEDEDDAYQVVTTASPGDKIARRVIADCGMKRRIMKEHDWDVPSWRKIEAGQVEPASKPLCVRCFHRLQRVPFPCQTLRLLAASYSSHPDYRNEWEPVDD